MKEKLIKIAKPAMLLAGFFMLFIAPRISPTIPTWAFWLGVICIVGFVAWISIPSFIEYYRKEAKKGESKRRKAIISGIFLLVFFVALFLAIRFSGLSAQIFSQWY